MKTQFISTCALFFVLAVSLASANVEDDRITSIPGWGPNNVIPFPVYAGYLNVSDNAAVNRSLYYVFTQSQSANPAQDPVILWLNGGPGCSSLMGLLTEIGPYVFEDGQAYLNGSLNPYSWNQRANIIFLEGPAGVGFSEANISNTTYSDSTTTQDQFTALNQFFKKFPTFKAQKFFIAGESYAGIYVPNLAVKVDENNAKVGNNDPSYINLAGIMVGNGVTNQSSQPISSTDFFYGHGQISKNLYDLFNANCRYNQSLVGCNFVQNTMNDLLNGINPYSIYRECLADPTAQPSPSKSKNLYTAWAAHTAPQNLGENIIPCVQSAGVYNYLNNATVRQALNVHTNAPEWNSCSDTIFFNYIRQNDTMPQYQKLKASGKYQIFVYSGDTDSVVPTIDTMNWVYGLNWKIINPYTPWYLNGQIGGYNTQFEGLNFTTVKGAGHMVPQWNRAQGLSLFNSFVNSTSLPFDVLNS